MTYSDISDHVERITLHPATQVYRGTRVRELWKSLVKNDGTIVNKCLHLHQTRHGISRRNFSSNPGVKRGISLEEETRD